MDIPLRSWSICLHIVSVQRVDCAVYVNLKYKEIDTKTTSGFNISQKKIMYAIEMVKKLHFLRNLKLKFNKLLFQNKAKNH